MGIITKNTTSGLIVKSENTGDNKPVYLTIQTGETTIIADEVIGEVNFQVPDEASGTDALLVAAGISAVAEDTFANDANPTKLSFKTAASEAAAEKMSLSSGGNLTLAGRIIIDDATEATSTTDGSLQTDGGLSVAKDVVAGNDLLLLSDSSVIKFGEASEITLTHAADVGLILEANGLPAGAPNFTLKNTNADATGARLIFLKDGTSVADNDVIGNIDFVSEDDGDNAHTYASIVASVSDMTGGAEGGKLTFNVAEHDGTVTAGLILADGDADGEIDVTIGAGANSVTTIAGDLDVPNGGLNLGSDASGDMYYRNGSGVLTRIAVGSDNHVMTLDGAVPGWEAASGGGDNEFHIAIQGFTYSHTSNTYFRTIPGSAGGIGYWTTAEAGQTTNATDTLTIDFQLAGPSGATFIAPAACTITELRGYIKTGSGADILTARLYKATGTDDETGTSDAMTATQMNAGAAISAATNGKCFTFSESISANNSLSAGDSLLLGFSANGTSTQKNYFTITIRGAWS